MRELTRSERLMGLSTLWSEAKYNYPMWHRHPGLDWDAEYEKRLDQAAADQSLGDYYRLLCGFTALVQDSHVNILPPQSVLEENVNPPIGLYPLDGKYIVVAVTRQTKTRSGVAPGDQVIAVDGEPVDDFVGGHIAPYVSAATEASRKMLSCWQMLKGGDGSVVNVGLRHPDGRAFDCPLTRTKARSAWVGYRPFFGGTEVIATKNDSDIGRIVIQTFASESVVEAFDNALRDLGRMKGLVIDLRANQGGNSGWTDAITGRLIAAPIPGMREKRLHYSPATRAWRQGEVASGSEWSDLQMDPLKPDGPVAWHGPLVLLTSTLTHSASEDFVGPLKCSGRARVVGQPTAGSTGNPMYFPLPGEGRGRVCTRYMLLPNGEEFIGKGIAPDVQIQPTVEDIASGRDVMLERAFEVRS
ncbi:MAG: S41 family peptidase [bacterium]|nr:S41 family peptidase [bacterium]